MCPWGLEGVSHAAPGAWEEEEAGEQGSEDEAKLSG